MSVKQISLFKEHKPGSLHKITSMLAENDIHIRALTVAETGNELSLIRFIVDNVLWTASVLKNAGYATSLVDVIVVKFSNVPGGLNHILEILENGNINIEHMYSLMSDKPVLSENAEEYMVFEVDNYEKALKILQEAGIKIIRQGELSNL